MTMAAADNPKSATEDLIVAVAKTGKDTARFRALKRRVDESLKTSLHGRTDQFAVAKQLEGLLEKFRVLNRDDLADALQPRLAELDEHRSNVFPELLSFLLQLADRPAQLSNVDRLAKPQPQDEEQQLSWTDFDASGAAYCDEDIWENVDYGASSSEEDDISSISSDHQALRSFTQIASEDDYVIPDSIFSSGEDEALVTSIKSVQFWRDENRSNHSESTKESFQELTELQIVREAIFMLQGLPTSLLWRVDGNVEVDRRYTLSHLSQEALSSVLRSISACGTKIDALRRFTRAPQSAAYMQTFHRSIEDCLHKFDVFLSDVQSRFLAKGSSVAISLLQLSDDVQRESKLLILLADLVSDIDKTGAANGVQCLDLLFDLVCITQAAGDDENFALLASIFFSSFETYARPLYRWMESGQLESPELFFISENRQKNDLRTLWHDWYMLDTQSELARIPNFLRPFAHRIFITGKSMVFLNRLNKAESLEAQGKTALSFEDVCPSDPSSLCLPFYALLDAAFSKVVNDNHAFTSSLLRKELDEQCGLWISLQALEHIHLCKDISLIGPIDTKIFELIDRRKGGWSDRFLLTELAQTAFGSLPFIDPTRLIVRSGKDADNRSRSVKVLSSLSFDYILPWPVANIITKDGIAAYQRVSTFLMQIRRAKYSIVKQRLQYSHHEPSQNSNPRGQTLSYALRHNLLWFLNVLYSHLTGFVISSTTESLRKSLSTATDVDSMIAAHRSYMASLEEQCLLSKNLHPLHQATITILDLCISFADLHAFHSQNQKQHADPTQTPRRQVPGKPFKTSLTPTPRKTRYEYSYGDEEDTDEDFDEANSQSEDEDDDEAGNHDWPHRRTPLHEPQYVQRLKDIQGQFNHLVAFLAAGLKGIGRVDGQVSWEMLAEKLEWRKERAAGWP
ncbi:putative gamma-tubulin complex component GCP5 [Aspergillus mulundensis]|uniref:Spindle pole body component n=1 Tax=Aspergillus mulundensis TaxID=1810919 RepID=A0A3D8T380_9EURO|nr:Spindle pole body component [Aspergillus mulundensis]RDW92979.1 Spindle pole body component [Aspergillus mulundensis]